MLSFVTNSTPIGLIHPIIVSDFWKDEALEEILIAWDGTYVSAHEGIPFRDGFICCCPYAADVREKLILRFFTAESYKEACMDI